MKIAFFSAHPFEKEFFRIANAKAGHEIVYFDTALNHQTAPLAKGYECICCFVTDKLNGETIRFLREHGLKLAALRSAGYNNVDLEAAEQTGLIVARVPAYSPYSVAEHAVGLLLSLNRKIHKAYARVREQNFSLEGLMGFDLHGKTVGVIGTGKIGSVFARILHGFGSQVLAHDPVPNRDLLEQKVVRYVDLPELYRKSDVISLHLPLFPETRHLIDRNALEQMKKGVILLNTGRGALIDTHALIEALKTGQVGGAGLDVYEEEDGIFFQDLSDQVLTDDTLARLLTFPHVLMTSHQGFFTREALTHIAETTIQNVSDFSAGRPLANRVQARTHLAAN